MFHNLCVSIHLNLCITGINLLWGGSKGDPDDRLLAIVGLKGLLGQRVKGYLGYKGLSGVSGRGGHFAGLTWDTPCIGYMPEVAGFCWCVGLDLIRTGTCSLKRTI